MRRIHYVFKCHHSQEIMERPLLVLRVEWFSEGDGGIIDCNHVCDLR